VIKDNVETPILVSACLMGLPCRYDGKTCIPSQEVMDLVKEGRAIPICPEQLGGLPTPRPPAEISKAIVINSKGEDVTENFLRGAEISAKLARLFGAKLAILKDKSPSCGSTLIYDGSFSGQLIEGEGITTALLKKEGVTVRPPLT
jgi:uncharacterized protein YbbK (DUF523 family)